MLVVAVLAAACGDTDAGQTPPAGTGAAASPAPLAEPSSSTTPGATEAPQRGGTLTWGWSLPSTWDPVTSAVGVDMARGRICRYRGPAVDEAMPAPVYCTFPPTMV